MLAPVGGGPKRRADRPPAIDCGGHGAEPLQLDAKQARRRQPHPGHSHRCAAGSAVALDCTCRVAGEADASESVWPASGPVQRTTPSLKLGVDDALLVAAARPVEAGGAVLVVDQSRIDGCRERSIIDLDGEVR